MTVGVCRGLWTRDRSAHSGPTRDFPEQRGDLGLACISQGFCLQTGSHLVQPALEALSSMQAFCIRKGTLGRSVGALKSLRVVFRGTERELPVGPTLASTDLREWSWG